MRCVNFLTEEGGGCHKRLNEWGGALVGSELRTGNFACEIGRFKLTANFTTEGPGASSRNATHSRHLFWRWRGGRQVQVQELLCCCRKSVCSSHQFCF